MSRSQKSMIRRFGVAVAILTCVLLLEKDWAQTASTPTPEQGQALQQRVAELKESMAANQAKLRNYQWTQATEVSIKGETKKDEQFQCRYGPDGKVQKTPIGPPPEKKEMPTKGLKGKAVQKKVGEMKDYTDRLKSLISHYAPPDPQKIQAAKQAGHANLDLSGGVATITIHDYYKPGD